MEAAVEGDARLIAGEVEPAHGLRNRGVHDEVDGALRLIVGAAKIQRNVGPSFLHRDGDRVALLRHAVGIDEVAEGITAIGHVLGEGLAQRAL